MVRGLIGLSTGRLLVSLALLAPTSSANFYEKVTMFGGRQYSYTVEPLPPVLTSAGVISAVRSHNVARVNKSYESFGDRFAAVAIDDLITSDLLVAVKGMRCAGPPPFPRIRGPNIF